MREPAGAGPLGGPNTVLEVDETFIGGKAKNRADGKVPPKEAVMALVERDGRVRSFQVASVNAKTLRRILTSQLGRKSYMMTDEAPYYTATGREFGGHGTVNHGIFGVYHHVSPKHLKRYVGESDFRYNARAISDAARANAALRGIEGKRLTYRRTG
jgi:ISXO2-like transposase domain